MAGAVTQNLTLVGAITDGNGVVRTEIWSIKSPNTGPGTITVTLAASRPVTVGVTTFTGVDQTTPLGTYASVAGPNNTGNASRPSVSVTSASTDLVYAAVAVDGDGSGGQPPTDVDLAPGSPATQLWSQAAVNRVRGESSSRSAAASPATTTTMSWGYTTDQQWAIGGVAIKPAGSAVAGGVATFTQTPTFCSPFTLPSGGTITVKSYYTISAGAIGTAVSASLKYGAGPTDIFTSTTATTGSDANGTYLQSLASHRKVERFG